MAEIYGDNMSGAGTGDHHRARWAPLLIVVVLLAVIVVIALIR
jgi:hypothetical protein